MELFEEFSIREIRFRNRIAVSAMCQYSAVDGAPTDWHLVHLGSRAVGGAGLILSEAAAVEPRGRISPADVGMYHDAHVAGWKRMNDFIRAQGCVPGIQLAHAGRKASTNPPWIRSEQVANGWPDNIVAPSAIAFGDDSVTPKALEISEIKKIAQSFIKSAQLSLQAGFDVVEIHAAHGYLLHEFLSPLSNKRTDAYGGSFENRIRLCLEVVQGVRNVWPQRLPLFARISATDYVTGGWDIEQSVELSKRLKTLGVDLMDCSSGGLLPNVSIDAKPGYQVAFAERIRNEAGIATGTVGMICEAKQAQEILSKNQSDLILIGREFLRDPYWPRTAALELGKKIPTPQQYARGW